MKINILIVDDHAVVRKGLKLLLNTESNLNVISEASSVDETLQKLTKITPDILITDINMPNKSGIELLKEVNHKYPHIKIIVLSMHFQAAYAIEAMDLGAKGYVSKDADESEIIDAIKKVYKGEIYFAKTVADELAKDLYKQKKSGDNTEQIISKREKEILKYIVEGLSNKMIADELSLSESTVNTHRYNIMKKLNARNSAELVRKALKESLI